MQKVYMHVYTKRRSGQCEPITILVYVYMLCQQNIDYLQFQKLHLNQPLIRLWRVRVCPSVWQLLTLLRITMGTSSSH